jgi:hypothetical protein
MNLNVKIIKSVETSLWIKLRNLALKTIRIGGKPRISKNHQNFRGCIRNVVINDKDIEFTQQMVSRDVQLGVCY